MKTILPTIFLLYLALLSSCGADPVSSPREVQGLGKPVREQAVGPIDLRGYGKISAEGKLWAAAGGDVALVRFQAEDEAKAGILASKYVTDLAAYGAVTPVPAPEGFGGSAFTVRHGGLWIIGQAGTEVLVLSGPDGKALEAQAKGLGANLWKAPEEKAYPKYLECFDNAALGMWWMAGTKPPEILDFFRENIGIVNAHPRNLSSVAPNVFDNVNEENIIAQARLIGKPYRFMIWADLPAWWRWDMDPRQAMEGNVPGALYRTLFEANYYQGLQVTSPEADAMLMDAVVRKMERYKGNDDLVAWLEPHGEYYLSDPQKTFPGAERGFVEYLQKVKGYTLAQANEAFGVNAASWETFPYPEMAYFFGRKGNFLDLDDKPWRWKSLVTMEDGKAQGFGDEKFDDASWAEDLRSSFRLQNQYGDKGDVHPLWYRFRAEVPASIRNGKKVYLNLMPYTERNTATAAVWVNGKEASNALNTGKNPFLQRHLSYDITDLLRAGENQFAIYSNGGRIAYRVFLNNTQIDAFPYKEAGMSRLWMDWNDYLISAKLQTLERTLARMRGVDPVRPIKVMTPKMGQSDALDLLERYGAYPQLTGESPGFYRPMHYKGYSRLRGMPASSEGGGPPKNERGIQGIFSNIFWESQDCHDYVFDPQRDFWKMPGCVDWWKRNGPLLKTLGKTDFGPMRVGELRDTEQEERYNNGEIWNWDLARGPLPAAGISPVLVGGKEFDRGMADKIPVIFDCATSVMTPERVEAVLRYVENGGTFVALHNTGRHSPLERDAWPLAKALGLKMEDYKLTKEGAQTWPTAKILFSKDQDLMPGLRGKTAEGSGISMDYQGAQQTGAVKIRGGDPSVKAVATWDDGSMAVCEVKCGKGKLIWLGSPFFLRFKDDSGKWMNDEGRQALFVDLLKGLGVERNAESSDPRVWFEKRESKNGLYDVFLADAMGIRGADWKLDDVISTTLKLRGIGDVPVIDATEAGTPDVAATPAEGGVNLPDRKFHPFQVRQFATVRKAAGLLAPLHWLEVQRRQWRALNTPKMSLPDVAAIAKEQAKIMGEDGMDLTEGWKVRKFAGAATPGAEWIEPGFEAAGWESGRLSTWLANGWKDAKAVQYRREVVLPAEWLAPDRQLLLGFSCGSHFMGIIGKAQLWLNGKPIGVPFANPMLVDITDRARGGELDLSLLVEGEPMTGGPGGVLYLRSVPRPKETLKLDGTWTTVSWWDTVSGTVNLPGQVAKVFGIRKSFELPKGCEGKKARLVVDQGEKGNIHGAIINGTGYFYCSKDDLFPYGVRIDHWLKPGSNVIDLYPVGHSSYRGQKGAAIDATISSVRIEFYDEPTKELKIQ